MESDKVLDEAEQLVRAGNPSAADALLQKSWPDFSRAPADALHMLGMIRSEQRNPREAQRLLLAAVASEPESLRHRIALGHVYFAAGDYAAATDAYDAALRIDREWPGLALAFSQAAYRAGRHAEAERAARHELSRRKTAEAWNVLACALRGLGKGQESLDAALEALQLDYAHIDAKNSRGAALLMLGRAAEALAIFDEIASSGVQAPVLSINRAMALEALGRKVDADAVYEDAAARWPDLPNLQDRIAQRRRQ